MFIRLAVAITVGLSVGRFGPLADGVEAVDLYGLLLDQRVDEFLVQFGEYILQDLFGLGEHVLLGNGTGRGHLVVGQVVVVVRLYGARHPADFVLGRLLGQVEDLEEEEIEGEEEDGQAEEALEREHHFQSLL